MLVSVKLNQIDRARGHAATTTRPISIGAMKIQAVRVLLFMEGRLLRGHGCRRDAAPASRGAGPPRANRQPLQVTSRCA